MILYEWICGNPERMTWKSDQLQFMSLIRTDFRQKRQQQPEIMGEILALLFTMNFI